MVCLYALYFIYVTEKRLKRAKNQHGNSLHGKENPCINEGKPASSWRHRKNVSSNNFSNKELNSFYN